MILPVTQPLQCQRRTGVKQTASVQLLQADQWEAKKIHVADEA